jgi:hypothetical protein
MKFHRLFLFVFLLQLTNHPLHAEEFYLESPRNTGTLRFEIDNDTVWNTDSQFTNGWSLQYHTIRYDSWEETPAPGFIKWIGDHFPTLNDDGSVVRYGQGIGQNMMTPGDLSLVTAQEGDMPYAGTFTYTFNWQAYNRQTARNFQISAGILGEAALAEQFQKFVHNDLNQGDDPKGWDTQRDSEPIVNIAYQYVWRLAHIGEYNGGWAGQVNLTPCVHIGNLFTAAEIAMGLRFGWNILEGFNAYPAPPGRGFYQAYDLPKPSSASPHSFDVICGVRATGLAYSVLYDGSILSDDDREVEREDIVYSGGVGFNYHYVDLLSIRIDLLRTSDVLVGESLPAASNAENKTGTDNSYGALMIDFHF